MFLTKNFKEKNHRDIPKTFLNAMIRNIKIHNVLDMIEISKFMESNKCTR